jgi:hypothetical protein
LGEGFEEMFGSLRRSGGVVAVGMDCTHRYLASFETREWLREHGGGSVKLTKAGGGSGGVAVLSLTNTSSRNALSGKMMAELGDLVDLLPE